MYKFSNLETYIELIKTYEHVLESQSMPMEEYERISQHLINLKREYKSRVHKTTEEPAKVIFDLPETNYESVHEWYYVKLPDWVDTTNRQEMNEYLWDNYGTEIWADYSPTGQLFTQSFRFAILNKERGGDGHILLVCETITRDV